MQVPKPPSTANHSAGTLRRTLGKTVTFLESLGGTRFARFRRQLGIAVNLMLLALLATMLYQNQEALPMVAHSVSLPIIAACLGLYFLSLLLQYWVWMTLMGYRSGERVRALEEYVRTILMGRLPGGIWKYVGRMTVYRGPRLSSKSILAINFLELYLALVANGLVLLTLGDIGTVARIAGVVAVLLTVVVVAVALTRQVTDIHSARNPLYWTGWLGAWIVAWVCGGLMVYVIVVPFGAAITLVEAVRYWCIAGAAGLLLQLLPLSTLIRDTTLVALLQPSMPLGQAIIAAFAIRLMMTACDLLSAWSLLGVAWWVRREPVAPGAALHK